MIDTSLSPNTLNISLSSQYTCTRKRQWSSSLICYVSIDPNYIYATKVFAQSIFNYYLLWRASPLRIISLTFRECTPNRAWNTQTIYTSLTRMRSMPLCPIDRNTFQISTMSARIPMPSLSIIKSLAQCTYPILQWNKCPNLVWCLTYPLWWTQEPRWRL